MQDKIPCGLTVDEILGETAFYGDVDMHMTEYVPDRDGKTHALPKHINCRCLIILPHKDEDSHEHRG